MPATPAAPRVDVDPEAILRHVPPWVVILHNDDHNTMNHVVGSLLQCVPPLTEEAAVEIMQTAHEHGLATVIACPQETAELYRDRLEGNGLTATIEAA